MLECKHRDVIRCVGATAATQRTSLSLSEQIAQIIPIREMMMMIESRRKRKRSKIARDVHSPQSSRTPSVRRAGAQQRVAVIVIVFCDVVESFKTLQEDFRIFRERCPVTTDRRDSRGTSLYEKETRRTSVIARTYSRAWSVRKEALPRLSFASASHEILSRLIARRTVKDERSIRELSSRST